MKALKKLSAILLFVLLALSLFVCVSADNISDGDYDLSVAGAYEFAESFLTEYYRAKDLCEAYDFSEYIQIPALETFVNGRIEKSWHGKTLYGSATTRNYSIEMILRETELLTDCIRFDVAVRVSFVYAGADFSSGYGERMTVLVSETADGYTISDIHDDYEPYFSSYRESTTVSDPNYWYSVDEEELIAWQQAKIASATASAAKQAEVQAEADALAAQMAAEQTEEEANNCSDFFLLEESTDSSIEPTSTSSTLYSLGKTYMVNWARANFNQENPITGNASLVPVYLDFSTLGENHDCTNFASHALLAGGAVFNQVGTTNRTSWYYLGMNTNQRSTSWSGVEPFYDFLTTNTVQGPAGYEVPYVVSSEQQFKLGDIIQLTDSPTVWKHTTIITSFIGYKPLVTGRSSPDKYNDNVFVHVLQEVYDEAVRVIHLTGYFM